MSEITTFTNNILGCEIRVTDKEGNPWFVAKDICNSLGVSNHKQAVKAATLDSDELGSFKMTSGGQRRDILCVSESGLYALVMNSRKPKALDFKRWIRKEVLPTIRKTGKYSVTPQNTTMVELAKAVLEQNGIIENLKDKEQIFGNRTPVGQLSDITGCPKFIPVRSYLRSNRKYKELAVTERQVALFTPA